jgi:hypothetical protein
MLAYADRDRATKLKQAAEGFAERIGESQSYSRPLSASLVYKRIRRI